jgi:hypothetical protein
MVFVVVVVVIVAALVENANSIPNSSIFKD